MCYKDRFIRIYRDLLEDGCHPSKLYEPEFSIYLPILEEAMLPVMSTQDVAMETAQRMFETYGESPRVSLHNGYDTFIAGEEFCDDFANYAITIGEFGDL